MYSITIPHKYMSFRKQASKKNNVVFTCAYFKYKLVKVGSFLSKTKHRCSATFLYKFFILTFWVPNMGFISKPFNMVISS